MKSWLEISKQHLVANLRTLQRAAGEAALLAVIKANAYGHGAVLCAPVLARAGAPWLGVTDAAEGACVREALSSAGVTDQPHILVMSGLLPEDAPLILAHGLTPVVWQRQQLEWLLKAEKDAAKTVHTVIPIHLEIDTGMARQGVTPGDALHSLLTYIKTQPILQLDGVFTHFASAEIAHSRQTAQQKRLFEQAIAAVAEAGLKPVWVHAGNSSTVDNQHADHSLEWLTGLAKSIGATPMVRPGLALYGYCLPLEDARKPAQPQEIQAAVEPALKPVMTWKTRVTGLRDIFPGDTVGYNATFTARSPMRLALLPVGYADGLRRELSSANGAPSGWVMIHGIRANIVGRVSMNLTIVDISGRDDVQLGDEAVLLGAGMTAEDHARIAETIPYEILCAVRATPALVD